MIIGPNKYINEMGYPLGTRFKCLDSGGYPSYKRGEIYILMAGEYNNKIVGPITKGNESLSGFSGTWVVLGQEPLAAEDFL